MTTDAEPNVPVSDALERIIDGTKVLHAGYFLFDQAMESKGLTMIRTAVSIIDVASPVGRDVLLPLLDHADETVRVTAACGLWQSHPELAVPLLEKMELTSATDAGVLAMQMLITKGRFNPCGSNPRYPNLYGDETDPRRWYNDDAYRAAIMSNASKH